MVLNAAARLVVGIGKYEHIRSVLRDTLHWLPVAARMQFKIAALTFWLCARRWSGLFQASYLSSLWSVMSVTPFCQPRWLVRFTGKHVHRPTTFFYRGSCCLEHTNTRPTLTAYQSPTVPIQAENSSVPTWFLWEQFAEDWNFVIVIVIIVIERGWLIVQWIPSDAKDISAWIVGPRRRSSVY